jgi:hypothetical protein
VLPPSYRTKTNLHGDALVQRDGGQGRLKKLKNICRDKKRRGKSVWRGKGTRKIFPDKKRLGKIMLRDEERTSKTFRHKKGGEKKIFSDEKKTTINISR